MRIRRAAKEDLKEISDIFRKETAKRPYCQRWTQKTAFEKIEAFFKKSDIYIVVIDKKIIGFIILRITVGERGRGAYIEELWLKSDFQRKGIGKNLMNFIENKCKRIGVKSIGLISDKRSNAFRFYKKLKYKTHNNLVLMDKKLR